MSTHPQRRVGFNNNKKPPQKFREQKGPESELVDHSPIDGLTGLIVRLGDAYIHSDENRNMCNRYGHKFDAYLPPDPILTPFYTSTVSIDAQINAITPSLLQEMQTNKKDGIFTVVHTILRAVVALPTKSSIYAALSAILGTKNPTFISTLIAETYRQTEAALKGMFVLMLFDTNKKNMNLDGTGKTKTSTRIIQTLDCASSPTMNMTTPGVFFELLLRFIASLTSYGCIPIQDFQNIIIALLQLCNIQYIIPDNNNYDIAHTTNILSNEPLQHSVYMHNITPYPITSLMSFLETLTTINTQSTIAAVTTNESLAETIKSHQEEQEQYIANTIIDALGGVDPTIQNAADIDPTSTPIAQTTIPLKTPARATIHCTAFNDALIHGILSALTFASRDVLDLGETHNKSYNMTHQIDNKDSILFPVGTNWNVNEQTTNHNDIDIALTYDFQISLHKIAKPVIAPLTNENELQNIIIDGKTLQLTPIEHFYVNVLFLISRYIYGRNNAFMSYYYHQASRQPAPLFISSPYTGIAPYTYQFFSSSGAFGYQSLPNPIISPANDTFFDYLTWTYLSITGSLPDGTVHIIRALQHDKPQHQWGLISRPFSIATPSQTFISAIKQFYIKKDDTLVKAMTKVHPFTAPQLSNADKLYAIPNTNQQQGVDGISGDVSNEKSKKKKSTSPTSPVPTDILAYMPPTQAEYCKTHDYHLYVTQPLSFLPILPQLTPKQGLPEHQANGTFLQNANNIDYWLLTSYLFYGSITYSGLSDEFMNFISTLPPAFPLFGSSQGQLYNHSAPQNQQACVRYVRQYCPQSLLYDLQPGLANILVHFFLALMIDTNHGITTTVGNTHGVITGAQHDALSTVQTSAFTTHALLNLVNQFNTELPPALGPRFMQLFRVLHFLSPHANNTLASWFAQHITQFDFNFPWMVFNDLSLTTDPTNVQYCFLKHVLTSAVQLTSFGVVAANVRSLWLLLPNVHYYLDELRLITHQSKQEAAAAAASSTTNNASSEPSSVQLASGSSSTSQHPTDPSAYPEQVGLLLPHIFVDDQVYPELHETAMSISQLVSKHPSAALLLTTLYSDMNQHMSQFSDDISPQILAQCATTAFDAHHYDILRNYVSQLHTMQVAQGYALDGPQVLPCLSVPQAATHRVCVENVNLPCVVLFIGILCSARATTSHLAFFLENYGPLLAVLSHSEPGDILHCDFDNAHEYANIQELACALITNANVGYTTPTSSSSTTTTNFNLLSPPSTPNPTTNSFEVYAENGFTGCSFEYENIAAMSSPQPSTISPSVISTLPNPTQLVLLDLLLEFYYRDLHHLPPKITLLLSYNIISLQTFITWLLFYVPRDGGVSSGIFNPLIIDILDQVLSLFMLVSAEKEIKQLDLFQNAIQQSENAAILTTMISSTSSSQTTSPIPATTSAPFDAKCLAKLQRIKQQQYKILTYKSYIFSTVFALLYDLSLDTPTCQSVLQNQAFVRQTTIQQNASTISHDEQQRQEQINAQNNSSEHDNDDDNQDPAIKKHKTSTQTDDSSSAQHIHTDDLSDLVIANSSDNVYLLRGSVLDFQQYYTSVTAYLLYRFKIPLRECAQTLTQSCQLSYLHDLTCQLYR